MTDLALAVDIGGTKMAAALVDRSGDLRHRVQAPTPHTSGPATADEEKLWQTVVQLVQEARSGPDGKAPIAVCGVGCGGPMSPDGEIVSPLNIAGWRGFPLRARLRELTDVPTFVDNDAKALALAEGWIGAGAGQANFIAMVVSTGIGGGLFVDGRLLGGRLGNAGHIGHVIVVPDGRPCACGGRGCLEAEASGTALAAIMGQPAEEALGFGEPFFAAAQREVQLRCGLDFARGAHIVPGALGDKGPLIGAGCVGWRGVDGSS